MRGAFMNTKLLTSILQCSNELITSDDFLANHRIGNTFTRLGKFSFLNLIYFVFQSAHKSIPINYSHFYMNFLSDVPSCIKTGHLKGHTRHFLNYSAFLWSSSISCQQIYVHGMISISMPLMEVRYKSRNQKKIIKYLVAIRTKRKSCHRLLPHLSCMMWWMIFWSMFPFTPIVTMNVNRPNPILIFDRNFPTVSCFLTGDILSRICFVT